MLPLTQHLLVIPVQERGHRIAVNRLTGAVGTVIPALRNALLSQPRDLLVELAVSRNIRKRRPGGCRKLRGTRIPVEERRHRVAIHRHADVDRDRRHRRTDKEWQL